MTEPITLASKDPNERYAYSWTPQPGDTIASGLSIVVTDGSATLDGSPNPVEDDATARFNLIGGTAGETTILTARATMASGDVIEQTIFIPIVDSSAPRQAITLATVKQYLRYEADETDQDSSLRIMLAGAQNWVERHTHKAFSTYATPDDIPAVMLQAMCLIVAMNDEERSTLGAGTTAVEWLLADYHRPAVA